MFSSLTGGKKVSAVKLGLQSRSIPQVPSSSEDSALNSKHGLACSIAAYAIRCVVSDDSTATANKPACLQADLVIASYSDCFAANSQHGLSTPCCPAMLLQGPRRLLSGSGEADADKSSGASAEASQKSGSEAAAGSSSRLTNPFAAASSKETRSASDSDVRTSSPLRGALSSSLGRFDPRALWGGASGSSKDGASKGTDQQGLAAAGSSSSATAGGSKSGAAAASAGSGSAAAYASRRFMSSSDDVGTTRSASEQPSAATSATGATALSSATAATPFSSATAAAPPPALGLLGQGNSSYSQRPGAGSFNERSSSRQEQLTTLPSEEIDEVWATLDSEKSKAKGGSSLNPSPEPGMRWRRDSEASAASSRSATPPRGLLSRSAEGALPHSSSRGACTSRCSAAESLVCMFCDAVCVCCSCWLSETHMAESRPPACIAMCASLHSAFLLSSTCAPN